MADKTEHKEESPAEPKKKDRSTMFGSGIGKMWVSDDWDSLEVNEEIAKLFNESKLFPDEP